MEQDNPMDDLAQAVAAYRTALHHHLGSDDEELIATLVIDWHRIILERVRNALVRNESTRPAHDLQAAYMVSHYAAKMNN